MNAKVYVFFEELDKFKAFLFIVKFSRRMIILNYVEEFKRRRTKNRNIKQMVFGVEFA